MFRVVADDLSDIERLNALNIRLVDDLYNIVLALKNEIEADPALKKHLSQLDCFNFDNMASLHAICKLFDNIDDYLPPEDYRVVEEAARLSKIEDKSRLTMPQIAILKDAVILKKRRQTLQKIKADLDSGEIFNQLKSNFSDKITDINSVENTWRQYSRFANIPTNILIDLGSQLNLLDIYNKILLKDHRESKNDQIKQKLNDLISYIKLIISAAKILLCQAFFEKIKLVESADLDQINQSRIEYNDNLCIHAIALLSRHGFMKPAFITSLLTYRSFKLTNNNIPSAFQYIYSHGNQSQKNEISELFPSLVPLPEPGHFAVNDLSLSMSLVYIEVEGERQLQDESLAMPKVEELKENDDVPSLSESLKIAESAANSLEASLSSSRVNDLTRSFCIVSRDQGQDILDIALQNLKDRHYFPVDSSFETQLRQAIKSTLVERGILNLDQVSSGIVDADLNLVHQCAREIYADVISRFIHPNQPGMANKVRDRLNKAKSNITQSAIYFLHRSFLAALLEEERARISQNRFLYFTSECKTTHKLMALNNYLLDLKGDNVDVSTKLASILNDNNIMQSRGIMISTLRLRLEEFARVHFPRVYDEYCKKAQQKYEAESPIDVTRYIRY